ncbi:MAG: hypothetical protein KDD60_09725 [Bdellovibrionales bacterium]|nr:hypothetical protein [Bdellovibrionales bacterium]
MMKHMMNRMHFGVFLLFQLLLVGCGRDSVSYDQLSDHLKQLGQKVDSYSDHARKVPELAEEEYEKLFRIDYRVVELPADSPVTSFEEVLGQLGKERWECFHIEPREKTLVAFCKRRPTSYIRYLGQLF